MTKDEALDLALEALQFALHVGFDESSESQIKKGDKAWQQHRQAITAIKQARALDKMADNARELGLDYEPVQPRCKVGGMPTPGRMCPMIIVGGKLCGEKGLCPHQDTTPPAQPAPDLQAELEATNRQVEILSDALAESRREVAQLKTQRQWVGLTDEEIEETANDFEEGYVFLYRSFTRDIEAKLKEKNNG